MILICCYLGDELFSLAIDDDQFRLHKFASVYLFVISAKVNGSLVYAVCAKTLKIASDEFSLRKRCNINSENRLGNVD